MATITGVNPTTTTRKIWALIPAWQSTKGVLLSGPALFFVPGRNPTGLVRPSQPIVKRNLTGRTLDSTVREPAFKGSSA